MNDHDLAGKRRLIASACPGLALSTDPQVLHSHGQDWTRFRQPAPLAVAFPASVEEIQALVRMAAREGIALVPSGGRTGLSGGAVAPAGELVVSFDRMRKVLEFNRTDRSLSVQAGVVTATVQQYAREHGLYYPVSFASEGSSQIGGNIATNAGGIRVLRYGLTRERVAGLKFVTGTSELLDCNRALVKNASGYDLRHLAIGSEGTLGFVVEATLWLVDPPPPGKVLFLGLDSMEALMNVFAAFRDALDLSAFEFLTDRALAHVCAGHGLGMPLQSACPLYVVAEFDCPGEAEENRALECFERCTAEGWLRDGLISQNERQNRELWRYREGISEAITRYRPYKNDLSVRVSKVPEFLERMEHVVAEHAPGFETVWYGHIGDGNLHLNIISEKGVEIPDFEERCAALSERTYSLTQELGGSISAEHGVGLLKQKWLDRVRTPAEISLMQGIKQVFDPAGIMNPGKLLP